MPNIIINEQEEVTFAPFDVTENTVLIPMLYARTVNTIEEYEDSETVITKNIYGESEDLPGVLYTSAAKLKSDILGSNHAVYIDAERTEFIDKSYIMAYKLLLQGLNVVIKPITYDNINMTNVISIDEAYQIMEDAINNGALDEFKDRNIFNIKFITTGGYANFDREYFIDEEDSESSEATSMRTYSYNTIRALARERGDAVALVELGEYFENKEELFESIQKYELDSSNDLNAAAFFPWASLSIPEINSSSPILMPASFCYLLAYAQSVKSNANWFAAAGTVRGLIPGLIRPSFEVGEALMHTLQGDEEAGESLSIMVNPIYNAGTYGYRIWGNRVVFKSDIQADRFMNFLNVRMLLCDIKKQIFHAAMRCTFEPNDDIVWINFKTLASSLLDRMKSGRGISWYKWTKEIAPRKAMIKATLTIRPIEAVESFDINIVLTDEEATIEEVI